MMEVEEDWWKWVVIVWVESQCDEGEEEICQDRSDEIMRKRNGEGIEIEIEQLRVATEQNVTREV